MIRFKFIFILLLLTFFIFSFLFFKKKLNIKDHRGPFKWLKKKKIESEEKSKQISDWVNSTIFVNIYHLQGEEKMLCQTIENIKSQCKYPDRVHVGFIQLDDTIDVKKREEGFKAGDFFHTFYGSTRWKDDKNDEDFADSDFRWNRGKRWFLENVKMIRVPSKENKGELWMRKLIHSDLFRNQKYYCFTRNGVYFKKDWDHLVLKDHDELIDSFPKCMLTQPIPLECNKEKIDLMCFPTFKRWTEFGTPEFKGEYAERKTDKPFRCISTSMNFCFSHSLLIQDWIEDIDWIPNYLVDWLQTISFHKKRYMFFSPSRSLINMISYNELGDVLNSNKIKPSTLNTVWDILGTKTSSPFYESVIDLDSKKKKVGLSCACGMISCLKPIKKEIPFEEKEIICKYGSVSKFMEKSFLF